MSGNVSGQMPARHCAWLTCVLALLFGHGASAADNPDALLSGYALTSWHDGAGRALGSVYAIAQDRDGYLWIGADAGLFRFDGSSFTSWSQLGGFAGPGVSARGIYVARDGAVWVGFSRRTGVARIVDGRPTALRRGLERVEAVTDIAEDAHGGMWAIGDRALFRWDSRAWHKVTLPWTGVEGQVYHVLAARSGTLWVATRWGVFKRTGTDPSFERVSDELVWGLGEDKDGRLWTTDIATGFRRFGQPPPRHATQGGGYRLLHDRSGRLWLSTFGNGLWEIAEKGGAYEVRRASTRTGLSSDSVQAVFEDRDGSLWVGTTGGLHRLNRRRLTPIDDIGAVLATAPAPGHALWVGTAGGLVRRPLSPGDGVPQRIPGGVPDVRNFHTDRDGVVWMGSGDGLWRYDGRRLEKVTLPGRPQMLVRWLAADPGGGFWLSDNDWLYHWNGRRLMPLPADDIPANARVRFAGSDARGRLWVGLTEGRLGYVDGTGFRLLGPADGLPDGTHASVNAVFDDGEDVWIGGTGLSRYLNGRIATIGRANGLPDGRVWTIVDDAAGNLWLSMDGGIVRARRRDLQRALADPTFRVSYQLFDARDGVAGSAIGVINATRAADGSLWFAQGGGLTRLEPQQLAAADTMAVPQPQIVTVLADEAPPQLATLSTFPAGTRRLEIHYAAPTLDGTSRVGFRYRLDGVDAGWVEAGSERRAVYTNLGAGQYRFRVEARLEGGGATSPEERWAFAIQPFFYQTRWFIALVAIGLGLSVWGAWRARLRLLEQRFSLVLAERARLSREIHDTLLQSLVGVALQLDVVSATLEPPARGARQQLQRMRRQVEQYIRDARQSILDLRSPHLDASDLAAALRAFGRSAAGGSNIRFTVTTTGDKVECPPQVENQLLRVGQEAITNAVRHASASRIDVDLERHDQAIVLSVSDDGRGFDYDATTSAPGGHYGLRTMQERTEGLGGRLSVTTEAGRGTTVLAVVPTKVVTSEELLADL